MSAHVQGSAADGQQGSTSPSSPSPPSAKGKELVWAPGHFPLRDDGAAPHPAAHLPQAADLGTRWQAKRLVVNQRTPGHRRPDGRGRPVAVAVSVVGLHAISRVEWPAFPSSNQLHALTTVGQVVCLLGLLAVGSAVAARPTGHRWRRAMDRPRRCRGVLERFTVVTLGMPLGATKLYLFGISVDQQFRTEYLTRLTDSPASART